MKTEGVDWPGWIQALCAVAAIFTAYWIVRYEERETRREAIARKIQFAVFTVEAIYEATWALTGVEESFRQKLESPDVTDEVILHAIATHVDRVRALSTYVDEIYASSVDNWPSVRTYLTFREEYKQWAYVFEEIVRHAEPDHALKFRSASHQAKDLASSMGEGEYYFQHYFTKHVDAVLSMVDTASKDGLPTRYLARIGVKTETVVDRLAEHSRSRKREEQAVRS